eukprot:COSAG02_NODE_909_length_16018_cov_15.571895_8_plen_102_part_00
MTLTNLICAPRACLVIRNHRVITCMLNAQQTASSRQEVARIQKANLTDTSSYCFVVHKPVFHTSSHILGLLISSIVFNDFSGPYPLSRFRDAVPSSAQDWI